MISKLARAILPLQFRNVLRPYFHKLTRKNGAPQDAREIIEPLGEPFASVLCSMYNGEPQLGADGVKHPLHPTTLLGAKEGMFLYRFFREVKPENSLEIGLAYGFSTTYILAALRANGCGRHVAVDPFQIASWCGIGLTREHILGMHGFVEFHEETSALALSKFAKEKRQFDLIFIDGDHKFDSVIIDFSLAAPICALNGYIVLDDAWMPAVQKALESLLPSVAVFQKEDTDERKWDHFVQF